LVIGSIQITSRLQLLCPFKISLISVFSLPFALTRRQRSFRNCCQKCYVSSELFLMHGKRLSNTQRLDAQHLHPQVLIQSTQLVPFAWGRHHQAPATGTASVCFPASLICPIADLDESHYLHHAVPIWH
jgi:hypothetical protein